MMSKVSFERQCFLLRDIVQEEMPYKFLINCNVMYSHGITSAMLGSLGSGHIKNIKTETANVRAVKIIIINK